MVHFARALRPHPVSLAGLSFISLYFILSEHVWEVSVRPWSHCFFCVFAMILYTDVRKSANVSTWTGKHRIHMNT